MSMFSDRNKMQPDTDDCSLKFKYEICDKVMMKDGKIGIVEAKISQYCRRYYDILIDDSMKRVIETDIVGKI